MSSERAFPSSAIDDRFGGMSLHEYYAGQALAGLCANHCWADNFRDPDATVEAAHRIADAMMAERKKRKEDQ